MLPMSGVASEPLRYGSEPLRYVSEPLRFFSEPLRFVSVPLRFVWSDAPWRAPEPRRVRGGRVLERSALRLGGRKRQRDREQRIL